MEVVLADEVDVFEIAVDEDGEVGDLVVVVCGAMGALGVVPVAVVDGAGGFGVLGLGIVIVAKWWYRCDYGSKSDLEWDGAARYHVRL